MIPRRWAYTIPDEWAEIDRWRRSEEVLGSDLVAQWERAVADYVGAPHAAAVNSGRLGMRLILEHLGVGADDEVIIPAYTLGDLVPLIQSLGAEAVPADIDPHTLNATPETIERRLTDRTKAILALHAFGAPADIERITALGWQHNIPVIEDCAHSLGATFEGKQTGSFGHAAFFSFEPTKPINTYGGGMVVSRDSALIDHIRAKTAGNPLDLDTLWKKVGATRNEQFLLKTGLGFPVLLLFANPRLKALLGRLYRSAQSVPSSAVRYSPVQAKLGLAKIASLEERLAIRSARAALLKSLLKPEIRAQQTLENCESTWYFFVVVLSCRASRVRAKLLLRGIDAGIKDEIADDCAALLGYDDCPNAAHAYLHALALPMYDGIAEESVRRVAQVLNGLV